VNSVGSGITKDYNNFKPNCPEVVEGDSLWGLTFPGGEKKTQRNSFIELAKYRKFNKTFSIK